MSEKQQGPGCMGETIRLGYWFFAALRFEYSMMVGIVEAAGLGCRR
jgi:hypothetical protein